jgi:cyclophilin family peptidyl-prolyl cis-trans isomerase/HEAT repeat protein
VYPVRTRRLLAAAVLMFVGTVDTRAQTLRERIIAAEDARNATDVAIAPILDGLRSPDPSVAGLAARALGRFERPSFVPRLLPLLNHQRADVRREAANALGQSLARIPRAGDNATPPEATVVTRAVLDRLATDDDPSARGTMAETLGRLPFPSEQAAREVEAALRGLMQTLHPDVLTGAVKGADAWVRFNQARYPPGAEMLERLRAVAVLPLHRLEPSYAFIRRIAWLAVNSARAADVALIKQGYSDPDLQVRRLSLLALVNAVATDEERRSILGPALKDPAFQVRYDAVRVHSRLLQSGDCAPIVAALDDASVHVQLAAIDALARPCPATAGVAPILVKLTEQLPSTSGSDRIPWHRPAHALVSLAAVDTTATASRMPLFASHPVWQVRAYAARAAAVLRDTATLENLARDSNDNVRNDALLGLRQVAGHAADAFFVEALARPDYQVILTAAQALEGAPDRSAVVPALLRAFARLTLERRETSRDPRVALLVRLREVGSSAEAAALRPCLADFDPVVAAECATTLQAWTGMPQIAQPVSLRTQSIDDRLPNRARFVMSAGGAFDVTLFPGDTPATISRFAQLARRGYYNGLTFHRVVPNFVIQGGSPGANEYAGDGPFMRDELALRSHTRGTVGLSTRGRDTGDAQFFVNLLDNTRLDHEFTVFGEVTTGMDAVDAVLEGDTIARIELQ